MCLGVCKWIVAFVFLYLIVIVLFVVLRGGLIVAVGQRAPRGRYSCKAQGASPGLIIVTHLLSPVGAALPETIAECGLFLRKYWVVVEVLLKTRGLCQSVTQPLLYASKSEA